MEIDEGRVALLEVIQAYSKLQLHDSNEAETRKKVIDLMLERVLGWNPAEDISYEETVRPQSGTDKFADYSIRTATTGLVVEAKRVGRSFELPTNRKAAKLGGVLSEGEVGDAIRQARDYAFNLSLQFAAATNGAAWIVFPAVRTDGVKWDDTEAHIFRDLADIKERFVEFWELLSRQRVIEGNLESTFFGQRNDSAQRRLISLLKEGGFRLGRNSIYEHIEGAIASAFTDESLLNDVDGLEFCYVKNSERLKYDSRLKIHLADAKPLLERKTARPRHGRDATVLDDALTKSINRPTQFLLILGPVGAGKTTFLHYTHEVSARKAVEGKVIWLYLDFKRATKNDNPRTFIYREMLAAIETDCDFKLGSWDDTIKFAYDQFVQTAKNGHLRLLHAADQCQFNIEISKEIAKERDLVEPYVERILSWTTKKHPIFLVVDNVDQFEEEQAQRDIFIEAQAAAKRLGVNVIMTLRDATYLRHRNTPSFDAFQVDSIYIDPPQTLPVLSRRFNYARKFLDGKAAEIITEAGKKFHVENLAAFMESVSASLLSNGNGFLIEILSGGDIRRALGLVREFLASGHTSSDRVLWRYAVESRGQDVGPTDKRLAFPRHEIFKGCVLGQRKFYREEDSLLPNIFDSKLGSSAKQLLRLHLLHRLTRLAGAGENDGGVVESIKADLYQLGVSDGDVSLLLKQLVDFRTVRTADGRAINEKSVLLPTRLGAYLVRDLGATFQYVEMASLDSVILEDAHWEVLRDLTVQVESATRDKQLELRLQRARRFMEYLQGVEEKWVVLCKRYQVGGGWDEQVVRNHLMIPVEEDLKRTQQSAAKRFERIRAAAGAT